MVRLVAVLAAWESASAQFCVSEVNKFVYPLYRHKKICVHQRIGKKLFASTSVSAKRICVSPVSVDTH